MDVSRAPRRRGDFTEFERALDGFLEEGGHVEFEAFGCENEIRGEQYLVWLSEMEGRLVKSHGFAVAFGPLLSHFHKDS